MQSVNLLAFQQKVGVMEEMCDKHFGYKIDSVLLHSLICLILIKSYIENYFDQLFRVNVIKNTCLNKVGHVAHSRKDENCENFHS
jgi:hypothetical protein